MSSPSRRASSGPDDAHHDEDPFESEVDLGRRQERIKRLIQDLISRWHWIALGLILGVLGASYYLSKAPPAFTAQARLLLKQATDTVIIDKTDSQEIDPKGTDAMNTVAQQIKRFELLQRVAARPDVRKLPSLIPPPVQWLPDWAAKLVPAKKEKAPKLAQDGVLEVDDLAAKIGKWLEVSPVRNSKHIDIKVTHTSNEVAMVVANAIAEEYQNDMIGGKAEGRENRMEILLNASNEARQKLESATGALTSYTRALSLHESLEAKENEVRQLSRRYLPRHPKMMAANGELKALELRFLDEIDSVRKSKADEAFWQANGKEMDSLQDIPSRLKTARQLLLSRSGVLKSEIDSQNTVFNTVLTQLKELDINKNSSASQTQIDSRARLEEFPTSPKKPLVLGAGAMGGLMAGFAFALVLVRMDNTFHTVAQLEAETGALVLASIAAIHPRRLAEAEAKARKKGAAKPEGVVAGWNQNLVFRPGLSSTPYAEMYRVLRASVSLLGDESRRKVTLFTSALPGEGKSLTSSNFALAAAAQGRRTLLIDLDLRKPNVHRVFGLKRTSHAGGVTECLAGLMEFEEVIFSNTGAKNLDIILAGKRAPNPGELLHPGKLKALLDKAVAAYDTVILDTAPLLAVPDTRVIAPLVDHLCMVTRADFVPKRAVFRALETLEDDGTKPSGLVFNGFTEKRRLMGENYSYGYYRRGYGYGGGYGSYGTYGEDDQDEEVEELVIPDPDTIPTKKRSTTPR